MAKQKSSKLGNKSMAVIGTIAVAVAGFSGAIAGMNMVKIPEVIPCNESLIATSDDLAQAFADGVLSVEPVEVPVVEYVNVSVPNPINEDMESRIALLEHDAEVFDEFLTYMEEHDNVDMDIFNDADDVIKNFMKEQRALAKVVEYVEDHIADELEDAGLVDDEDDVDFKKANIDYDEYESSSVDFDDNQFTFDFEVTVKNDGDTESYDVTAEFDDGEISISVE